VHGGGRLLRGQHLGDLGHRLEVEHAVVLGVVEQHLRLRFGTRIAERDAHHEAVELRLGQRVGALVLHRVLRGHDQERPRQLMRVLVHGHVALLHALEQPRLSLWRRSVDLVDQDHVGEHRPRPELEAVLALVVDVGADHVGGQQIGGALHARVLGVDRARQRPRQGGLADARVVLDQHVPLGQHRDQHVAQHALGGLDRPRDVVAQAYPQLGNLRGVELRHGRHASPW
jgi:hypothetical protein